MIGLMLVLFVVILICSALRGCSGGGVEVQATQSDAGQAGVSQPTAAPARTRAAAPVAAATAAAGRSWLVMLYLDADDKVLEQDLYVDLNEAERAGSTDAVQIVSQIDRFRGGFRGDGDWTAAKRFYVIQDDDLGAVRSQEVGDLGEANMADGQTLVDFATWAMETYPADKYVLILSDHGMGWPGGWSDPTASGAYAAEVPLEQRLGDLLYLDELDEALGEIRDRTGLDEFELIGLDACLMGHLEVFSALEPHARYAVASQETEPSLGWAYASFLSELQRNPNVSGAELGRYIVDSYIEGDERVTDDQARLEFATGGRGLFGSQAPSASALADRLGTDVTLAAVDLAALPQVVTGLNGLAYQLQQASQRSVAQARRYAQSFTSIFGSEVPPSYIDLGNFAQLVAEATRVDAVAEAANGLTVALGQMVVAERHGADKPGATGVSIYFPNSQLYRNPVSGYQSYVALADRFAQESLWDEFLAYHYTGREFDLAERNVTVPAGNAVIRGPAEGGIQVSAITASGQTAAPGEPVLLSVDIDGENVGYVRLLVGYYDQAANSINLLDEDYLESQDTGEVDGVYYPVWPEGGFTLEFEWEPVVFAIDDGTQRVPALFQPQTYGASFEDATYAVDGTYTYGDDGESRPARLLFRNGALQQVFGFTGDGTAGAPREIVPQPGDTFTVLEQWLDVAADGGAATRATEAGSTLTFSDQPFTWVDLDAAAGLYVVGFIVEDLDGKEYPVYTQVTVE
ncbi:MAG: clostripain-related cysteine peptidase [Anaerolineae bacterium]